MRYYNCATLFFLFFHITMKKGENKISLFIKSKHLCYQVLPIHLSIFIIASSPCHHCCHVIVVSSQCRRHCIIVVSLSSRCCGVIIIALSGCCCCVVVVVLLQCCCCSVVVVVSLLSWCHHCRVVVVSLSLRRCHHHIVVVASSPCHCRCHCVIVIVAVSLSLSLCRCHCHVVAVSLPSHHHHVVSCCHRRMVHTGVLNRGQVHIASPGTLQPWLVSTGDEGQVECTYLLENTDRRTHQQKSTFLIPSYSILLHLIPLILGVRRE